MDSTERVPLPHLRGKWYAISLLARSGKKKKRLGLLRIHK
jgi:hypothetical protein